MRIHLSLLALVAVLQCSAQLSKEANIWHFGEYAGLDFNGGAPVALAPSAMDSPDGCASIADSNGQLLFYTDGETIWDWTHNTMSNGTGLLGYKYNLQSAFIVPSPAGGGTYYVFTADHFYGLGFRYSVVDMSLNGGLGDVVVKNQLIMGNPANSKFTAVRHANGRDVWLVVYGFDGSNNTGYHSFLLDTAGVSGPYQFFNGTMPTYLPGGHMKFSSQGHRLANVIATTGPPPTYPLEVDIEVLDFDLSTGIVSNPFLISGFAVTTGPGPVGLEFSSSGRFLYASGVLTMSTGFTYQYDLHAGTPSSVKASEIVIANTSYMVYALQMGPDGKIYQAVHIPPSSSTFLNAINQPNKAGNACLYNTNQVPLYSNTYSYPGLPDFLTSYFSPFKHEDVCLGDYTHFYVPDSALIDSAHWNFGDPLSGSANTASGFSVYHQFTDTGYYDVSLIYFRGGSSVDTFTNEIRIWDPPVVDLGPDIIMCRGDSVMLDAFYPKATYQWFDGSLEDTIWIYSAGTHWVKVMNPCDTVIDTIVVSYTVNADFASGPNCVGVPAQFTDSSTTESGTITSWLWNFNNLDTSTQQHPTFVWPTSGLKTVTLIATNDQGCSDTISKFVMAYNPPALSVSGDATICLGDSSQLIATGNGTVLWSPSATLNDSTSKTPIATPPVGTIYTVTLTALTGCTSSDSVTINVAALPVVDTGLDAVVCNTTPAQLSALATDTSAIASWSWSPSTGLSSTTIADPTANPPTQTTYTVTATNAHGCSASDSVTVFISNVSVDAGSDTNICEGEATQLNATSPNVIATWSWSPATGLGDPNIADPAASPSITTVYTVTATDSLGCSATDDVTITVTPYPIVTITPDTFMCDGGSVQLNVSGGVQHLWDLSVPGLSCYFCTNPIATPTSDTIYCVTIVSANGCAKDTCVRVDVLPLPVVDVGSDISICEHASTVLSVTPVGLDYLWSTGETTQSIIVSPDSTTTFIVTGTDAFGCENVDEVTVTVNPLSTVTISATDTALCEGASTALSVTPVGLSYVWSTSDTTSAITVQPTSTTTYTVTGTDANSCEASDTVMVTVNPLPVVDAGPDQTICLHASTVLSVTPVGLTYVWSNGMTGTPIIVSPTSNTTYTVIGTDANGCEGTDSVTVIVNPQPTVLAQQAPTGAICEGESVTLSASGALTYQWSTGATTDVIVESPSITTTYSVIGTDANGCSDTTAIVVTVNPLPIVVITGNTDICEDASTVLSVTGGVSYVWSTGETTPSIIVSPTSNTNYSVIVTDANGCSNTDDVTVNVHLVPTVDAGVDVDICEGDETTLIATGAATYLWSTGEQSQSISITPMITTTYTVTGTDVWGCENDDEVTVSVFALPFVEAIPSEICRGEEALLRASSPDAITYTWQPGNLSGDSVYVTPIITTTYTVTGMDANGCESSSIVVVTVSGECPVAEVILKVPTAFTPNADGLNDMFRIEEFDNYTFASLRIYNRWGEVIFESRDITQGWDGRANGHEQPLGTYVFVISGVSAKGEALVTKGNLTLLR